MENDWLKERYQKVIELCENKEFEDAMQVLEDILTHEPDFAPAYNKIGVVKAKNGNLEGAEAYFNKAIALWPEFSSPYSNLGNVRLEQHDTEAAENYYLKALEVNAENPIPYNNLARIYKNRKQIGDFIAYQKLSLKNRNKNGDQEVFRKYFGDVLAPQNKSGSGCLSYPFILVILISILFIV